jgi:hypothetical protein
MADGLGYVLGERTVLVVFAGERDVEHFAVSRVESSLVYRRRRWPVCRALGPH